MRYSGTELDALAEAHNYYRWILECFRPYIGHRILEIGAGAGTFTDLLLRLADPDCLVAAEPADNLFPALRRRFEGEHRVLTVHGSVEAVPRDLGLDAAVMVNVLEHVEDTSGLLRAVRDLLARGGRLLVLVPAGPALFGSLDEAFGHFRRYSRPSLRQALAVAGFSVTVLRYMNLPGIVSWYVAGRILRKRTLTRADVQAYDRWIVPLVRRLEAVVAPPCGQSLLAVATRTEQP